MTDIAEQWPVWAQVLIAMYGSYSGPATSYVEMPPNVLSYIVTRMRRERLDAMLDAEIGA
jgi:hypothetical protein